jgi:GNAT superfamily N-acetyltransferase
MDIRAASADDLDILTPLFDGYRQFYGFASDLTGARAFLNDRFDRHESTIFLAFDCDRAVGFTQLYPSFSSGRMARIYVLNDLFVMPEARGGGAGRALIAAAQAFGKANGAARLTLSTVTDNLTAQSLYEACGWERETDYYTYNLAL